MTRALLTLQRSIAEAGRIRIGKTVPTTGGRSRPTKLDTFRLTSSDRRRIEQAAEVYGGTVEAWTAPAGEQWQVITTRTELDVIVPPADLSFSQAYELWSAGGCLRRCDGVNEAIGERPCACDPAARECDIHTRLSVLLRDLPGLGVWRIDTQGYYAATELAGAVEIIGLAAGAGGLLPARLRLDQRAVKRPGANGKPQTFRFAVPVLDVEVTPALLLAGGQGQPLELATRRAPLTPVPLLEPPTIAEQSEPPAARAPRRNAAPPIPSTGRSRAARATDATEESEAGVATGRAEPEEPPAVTGRSSGGSSDLPVDVDPAELGIPPDTDPEYWMKRLHALAADRGIDHDGLRLIAAAAKRIPAGDVYSLRDLDDTTAEGLDKLLRQFPDTLDLDAATEWVSKIAERHGLDDWPAIEPIAAAAIGVPYLDEAGTAEWIAFGLRLHAGEYDGDGAHSANAVRREARKARATE